MRFHHFLPLAVLLAAIGCQPIEEQGIDLPGSPEAAFDWEYLCRYRSRPWTPTA